MEIIIITHVINHKTLFINALFKCSVPGKCAEGSGGFYALTSRCQIGISKDIYIESGTIKESERRSNSNKSWNISPSNIVFLYPANQNRAIIPLMPT